MGPDTDDERVAERLGRPPSGAYAVVVRDAAGAPVVLANAPFLDDGTPMPTLFWLVGPAECLAVSRLETDGGVRRANAEVDAAALAACHAAYAARRDALIDRERRGPRPTGGVGGTRAGVKCLHAHYAHWLAGGDDPVGDWVQARLVEAQATVGLAPRNPPLA